MLLHYFITAFKITKRYQWFSLLNILGLTLGLSSCLLIILYLNFELGFDKFHDNHKSIYRVVMKQPGNKVVGSSSDWWVVSPYILKPTWEQDLPEIDLACRKTKKGWSFKLIDRYVNEEIMVTDPEFFEMFTFPLDHGNQLEALSNPYSMVISKKIALKYFGEENPLGKTMETNDGDIFKVTGVLKDVPENSHLKFDILVSFQTLESMNGKSLLSDNWLNNGYRTYLILQDEVDLKEFDAKLRRYDVDGFNGQKWSFHLQPLEDIHFNRQIGGTGDKGKLFIFLSVGVFILLIAGFNYMNLYLAHYRSRTKNVGIRRISGATRGQLFLQFLSESFLSISISLLFSILLVWCILPLFNDFIGEQLNISMLWDLKVIMLSIGTALTMVMIAGAYPAFYLSGLKVNTGTRGKMGNTPAQGSLLKKGIMILQFAISIILVIGTITAYKQLSFMNTKSLGFSTDQILYIGLNGTWYKDKDGQWKNKNGLLKSELLKNPDIYKVAGSSGIPSKIGWSNIPVWEGQPENENPFIYRLSIDEDFVDLYGIEIKLGRKFTIERSGDIGDAYLLNEAAVKSLGLENPVGAGFGFDEKMGTVVGVVEDFHFESLHKPITPLGIGFTDNERANYFSLKINGQNIPETIEAVEKIWDKVVENEPFNYSFLDERLGNMYKKDRQLAKSLNYFSLMAIIISCLGIFGIMLFTIKEKTKEIGIRKVLGASFIHLLKILTADISIIFIIGGLIGGVLGWHSANEWLSNFAYRIEMDFWTILFASGIILLIALIPLGFTLKRAFVKNPTDSLRIE